MFRLTTTTSEGQTMYCNDPVLDPVELINVHGWLTNTDPLGEHHERFNGLLKWTNGEPHLHGVEMDDPLRTFVWFKNTKKGLAMSLFFKLKWC